MTVKYKPIFQCDGCSLEFEDPDKVRIFESLVKNGDETKQYIDGGMFCLDCIPLALDFTNQNPETMKIVDPTEALADVEDQFEKQYSKLIERMKLDNLVGALNEKIDSSINNLQKQVNQLDRLITDHPLNSKKSLEQFENEILTEEAKIFIKKQESLPKDWPHPSELVGKEDPYEFSRKMEQVDKELEETILNKLTTASKEPETIQENDNSETIEDARDTFGDNEGRYLILQLINDENKEKHFAQSQGYDNIKDLRATCGKSLVGLYYSTNRFINDLDDAGPFDKQVNTKIINKMFFGVPSIVERKIFIYDNLEIALIEKELFEDKIEAIKYELPPEPDIEIPSEREIIIRAPEVEHKKTTVNNMLDKFVNAASEITKPKKLFSSRNVGDEYI